MATKTWNSTHPYLFLQGQQLQDARNQASELSLRLDNSRGLITDWQRDEQDLMQVWEEV